jgi:hypothetical protein
LPAAKFPSFTRTGGGIDGWRKFDPSTVSIYQIKWSVTVLEKSPISC